MLAEATVNESGLGAMDTNELERALAGKSTYVDFRSRKPISTYSRRRSPVKWNCFSS
jgi:hypothetical protein